MASSVSLKSFLRRHSKALEVLESVSQGLHISWNIRDSEGNLLYGNDRGSAEVFDIANSEEVIGTVNGEGAGLLAQLLSLLINQESEKKQIGSEVLDLYREINLIYNFSEKLSKVLDARTIARTALEEVCHLIESTRGQVMLRTEKSEYHNVLAFNGELFQTEKQPFRKILESNQSGILNNENGQIAMDHGSLLYAPLKVNDRLLGVIILGHEDKIYTAAELKLLTTIALQSAAAIESALLYESRILEAREREEAIKKIHEATTRFVPHEFIRSLGHDNITEVHLGEHTERDVTVMFTDIRDYTTLSEQMSPEENFNFVQSFNQRIGPIIQRYEGFINQYLGDGLMAIFADTPEDALKAAIAIQLEIQAYNNSRSEKGRLPIRIGIGLHTGALIMGIIGHQQRLDATTISDTVNTASRLESLTKTYKAGILLSESSKQLIPKDTYPLRSLGSVHVKGKTTAISIYECYADNPGNMMTLKERTLPDFSKGINALHQGDLASAIGFFRNVVDLHPEDATAGHLLDAATQELKV